MHRFFDRRRRGPSRFLVLLALLALAGTACADVVVPEAPAADEAPAEDEVPASEAPAEDDAAEEAPAEDEVPAGEAPAGEAPAEDGAAEEAPAGDAAAGSGGLTEAQVADLLEGIESEISIAQLRSLCDNAVLRSLAAAQIAASGEDVPADVLDQLCAVIAAG